MKTYYLYNILTDEFLGTVTAAGIIDAERKGAKKDGMKLLSIYIAAYSEKQ